MWFMCLELRLVSRRDDVYLNPGGNEDNDDDDDDPCAEQHSDEGESLSLLELLPRVF